MGGAATLGRTRHGSQARADRKVIQVALTQAVTLHTCPNAWKPPAKALPNDDPENVEKLYRSIRGILNKLTPQKFETLLQQVYELDIDTEKKLTGCIDIIFEKAISEPSFSVAYAEMAKCLLLLKVPTALNPEETVTFRKLLLNRCQREFEKDKAAELDLENMQRQIDSAEQDDQRSLLIAEKQQAEMKARMRSLGNIRFIGELFKLKMLTEHIMDDCISRLLRSHDEESVECLCRLLVTIGGDIDTDKLKHRVDDYFLQLAGILNAGKVSARIKFMIKDVIDLRGHAWIPRRADNKPKTIDEIHRDAEKDLQQQQQHGGGRHAAQQQQQQQQRSERPSSLSYRPLRSTTPGGAGEFDEAQSNSVCSNGSEVPSRLMGVGRHFMDEGAQFGAGGWRAYRLVGSAGPGPSSRTPSTDREVFSRIAAANNSDFQDTRYDVGPGARSQGLRGPALRGQSQSLRGQSRDAREGPDARGQSRDTRGGDARGDGRDLRGGGEGRGEGRGGDWRGDGGRYSRRHSRDSRDDSRDWRDQRGNSRDARGVGEYRDLRSPFQLSRVVSRDSREEERRFSLPQRGGKSLALQSMEQDRSAAIATVRSMVAGATEDPRCTTTPSGSRLPSRNSSKSRPELSRCIDSPASPPPPPLGAARDPVLLPREGRYAPPQPPHRLKESVSTPVFSERETQRPAVELSEEKMEKKNISILDEFLSIHNFKEAELCVAELSSSRHLTRFVVDAVLHCLSLANQAREETGRLLSHLVRHQIISFTQYMDGMKTVLGMAEDLSIDVPKIWLYLGQLIGAMIDGRTASLQFLLSLCAPLRAGGGHAADGSGHAADNCGHAADSSGHAAGLVAGHALHAAARKMGNKAVGELWMSSGLDWVDFMPSSKVPQFIKRNELEFTEFIQPTKSKMADERLRVELDALVVTAHSSNKEVIDWIKTHLSDEEWSQPPLVRALMMSICQDAMETVRTNQKTEMRVNSERLKGRCELLVEYLRGSVTLELQTLYALQAFVHKLEHPPDVLRAFFNTLHDEEVISEDAFYQWRASTDLAESAGKGIAQISVSQFYTWLDS